MGISSGQSFGHLVFALANVGEGFVKKSVRSFFHNNVLQACHVCPNWASDALSAAWEWGARSGDEGYHVRVLFNVGMGGRYDV